MFLTGHSSLKGALHYNLLNLSTFLHKCYLQHVYTFYIFINIWLNKNLTNDRTPQKTQQCLFGMVQ